MSQISVSSVRVDDFRKIVAAIKSILSINLRGSLFTINDLASASSGEKFCFSCSLSKLKSDDLKI